MRGWCSRGRGGDGGGGAGDRWLIGAIAAMVVLGSLLVGVEEAGAQTPTCDAVVVDEAGVITAPGALTDNANFMAMVSATRVRVRTVVHVDPDQLDAYERTLEAQCPSWQRADGGRAPDLVLLLVAPNDRQTGIYYGADAQARLDPVWRSVQTNRMNPAFARGDFDTGIHEGILGLQEAFVPPPAPPVVIRDQPSGRSALPGTGDVGMSSSSPTFGFVLLLGAALLVFVVLFAALRRPGSGLAQTLDAMGSDGDDDVRPWGGRPRSSRWWGSGNDRWPGGGFGGGGFGGGSGFSGGGSGADPGGGSGGGSSSGGGGGGGDGGGGSTSW